MKVKYLLAPAAGFALWRAYIIVKLTGEATGFLPRGSVMGWLFMLSMLFVCALLYFPAWKRAPGADLEGDGALLTGPAFQGAMLLAAAGLAMSAALALRDSFRGSLLYAAVTAAAALSLLLLVPAAAGRRTARPGTDGYLALVLVAWGVIALLCVFLSNNTVTSIPENTLSLLSAAALLAALFSGAKLRVNMATAGGYLRIASVAALVGTAAELPGLLLRVAGFADRFVSKSMPVDFAVFFMLPVIWASLFAVEKHAAASEPLEAGEQS
ncbi:MAG TPA: hypothetical protein VN369_01850 [Terriglobales bacterium]|nr:hypothetical protein [Terriglobales bacterium]